MRACLLVGIVCLLSTEAMAAEGPGALELLDKYQATQDSLQRFIIKSETQRDLSTRFTGKYSRSLQGKAFSGKSRKYLLSELRFDGERYYMRQQAWGSAFQDPSITKDSPYYASWLWDGKQFIRTSSTGGAASAKAQNVAIKKGKDHARDIRMIAGTENRGAALLGYFHRDYERIDSILRGAHTISVRDKRERIGESDCYVIDAATELGKYTVWIDPAHGHHIAKAAVRKGPKDLVGIPPRPLGKRVSMTFSLEVVRFEKVDNVWVPMEAHMAVKTDLPGNNFYNMTQHHKRTEVILNPDCDALNSFAPDDIENGAEVRLPGAPNKKYRWKDGKPAPESGN